MRVMITRPREDAEALARLLDVRGIASLVEPLLDIVPIGGPRLDLAGVQALLVTSANGIRALAARDDRRDLPVFAVGDASAGAAADAGFRGVDSASGDVADLARRVMARLDPGGGDLLHVAGTRLAGDLAGILQGAGFTVRREVLYQARTAHRLSPAAVDALKAGAIDGVMLFSPRTAAIFVDLARQAGVAGECGRITAYCLSPAVAGTARAIPWGGCRVAVRADQAALLDVLGGSG